MFTDLNLCKAEDVFVVSSSDKGSNFERSIYIQEVAQRLCAQLKQKGYDEDEFVQIVSEMFSSYTLGERDEAKRILERVEDNMRRFLVI